MARIMFVWELGLGYGHLAPYKDLVKKLRADGHTVVFAARDVASAEEMYGGEDVTIVQAPMPVRKVTDPYRVQHTYAQLLHNNGFGNPQDLLARVKAWMHVFLYVRPDLVVYDHSPTALIAARATRAKRIVAGSGFLLPPPGDTIPPMRYWERNDAARLRTAEQAVLKSVNTVLGALRARPLERLHDLFAGDAQFLLGFHELDHYPMREGGNYLGIFPTEEEAQTPAWPATSGKKVFAYLHPFRAMEPFFRAMSRLRLRTLVYAPELPEAAKKKLSGEYVRFAPQRLDLRKVLKQADAAVTSGTYATTCAALLCGRPVLMLPQNLERIMVARRVVTLGAGLAARANQPQQFAAKLRELVGNAGLAEAAREFAKRHAAEDQAWQTKQMLTIANGLLAERAQWLAEHRKAQEAKATAA